VTTTLRVIVDQMVGRVPGGIGRYTEELTRELIATAPRGCVVEGIVSAVPAEVREDLTRRLPGLAELTASRLSRRQLARAWQLGLPGLSGGGMIHAPSLLAPLHRHDPEIDATQVVVTIHDVVPWTHPETLTPHGVRWHKAMAKRASRYADAVVVPTHAVAEELSAYLDFGDRVRVIGGAVASTLELPADPDARAAELGLPPHFLLTVGTLEPRKGLAPLIQALARPETHDLPLLVVGPQGWGDLDLARVAHEAGVAPGRVRSLGFLSDTDLALVLQRATLFVHPSLAEGFGLPIIEAFSFGTPVIHSDAPALVEVGASAAAVVERADAVGYPARLAAAVGRLLGDGQLRERYSIAGRDRARAFSWRDSAERVWQLHADL
jgi:glycosyltransferase involved in cell wall biosynthesis